MVALGALGFFGFPLYYVVWKWIFPQPFESFILRLIGSALFLPLLLVHQWPQKLRHWIPLYWYVSVTLAVPFFFTYMMLMNHATTPWLASHLTSIFLILLLFDLRSFLVTTLTGTVLAVIAFALTPHIALDSGLMLQMAAVWAFALVAGGVFSVSEQRVVQSKIDMLVAASGNVAHELRTPLTTVTMAVRALQSSLPRLIQARHAQGAERSDKESQRTSRLDKAVDDSLRIAGAEVAHMHTVIDMLLTTVRPSLPDMDGRVSAREIIAQAMQRYPFASRADRNRVSASVEPDFLFRGSEQIAVHVLFNLIKNGLFHTGRAGKGNVVISTAIEEESGVIRVHDTGSGIAPGLVPHVFDRFVTGDEEEGLGIGLAFCNEAIQQMGGSIECSSRYGEYSTFLLHFPLQNDSIEEEQITDVA